MAYAIVIYVSSTLSLLTNVSLLALFLRFRLKAMKSYKYFFAVMAVHDVAMSASMILCVPVGNLYVQLITFLIKFCRRCVTPYNFAMFGERHLYHQHDLNRIFYHVSRDF